MIAWAVLLFVAGTGLILAEFVVPGLICGILGSVLVIASAAMAYYIYPDYLMFIILVELVGVIIAIIAGMVILSRTRAANPLILQTSQQANAGWVAAESDTALLGARGAVSTALRPAGTILINGKRIDAVSDGAFIDKGAVVRVIAVQGSRVVVEAIIDAEQPPRYD
jgi:membrane-bound serine protease (ClpP class)